ncbi:MAG: IS200/IS605 family transposase [Prevotellaceae bacterium]|jgi:REP element-mobilizing transposase RayT|nr:IS200/IS605 family transposase [Prevotellaceae bacterium]
MAAYYQTLHHIVFRTKYSERTLREENRRELYAYIYGIIKHKQCTLYRINGMSDHIHILSDLHPTLSLSEYVKDIKVASSVWMKQSGLFPEFRGWSKRYCALACSKERQQVVIEYIKNQQAHHVGVDFAEELRKLCEAEGVILHERFFSDD